MIAINIRVMYIGIKITKEKWDDLSDLTNDNVPLENYGQYRYRGKKSYTHLLLEMLQKLHFAHA